MGRPGLCPPSASSILHPTPQGPPILQPRPTLGSCDPAAWWAEGCRGPMGMPNPAPAWWVGRGLGDSSFASDLQWGESAGRALSLRKPRPPRPLSLQPDSSWSQLHPPLSLCLWGLRGWGKGLRQNKVSCPCSGFVSSLPPQQRTAPHWRGGAWCFCALEPRTRVGSISAGSSGPSWTEPRTLLGMKGRRGNCTTLGRASRCDGHPKPRASAVPCLKSVPAGLRWRELQALGFMRAYWALRALCSCQGRGQHLQYLPALWAWVSG